MNVPSKINAGVVLYAFNNLALIIDYSGPVLTCKEYIVGWNQF